MALALVMVSVLHWVLVLDSVSDLVFFLDLDLVTGLDSISDLVFVLLFIYLFIIICGTSVIDTLYLLESLHTSSD
jgi:hypothetical protein